MIQKDKNYSAILKEAEFNVSIVKRSIARDGKDVVITSRLNHIENLISQVMAQIEEEQGNL